MLTERFVKKYRHVEDDYVVSLLVKELSSRGCFFTPANNFLSKVFGEEMRNIFSEYFFGEESTLLGGLSIPIYTIKDEVLGLILNKPLIKAKYRYPDSFVTRKGNCLGLSRQALDRALDRGYIFINEGVFDEIFISSIGEPAMRLDGSTINKVTARVLDMIPNKIVISDNDEAGSRMFKNVSENLNGNVVSLQLPEKDIADYLRTKEHIDTFLSLVEKNKEVGFQSKLLRL